MYSHLICTIVFATLVFFPLHSIAVEYDFNVTWVQANPDGLKDRRVIGINDEWPPPVIFVDLNDTLVVKLRNQLQNPYQNTSLHFHGLVQNGSNFYDGAVGVTQCALINNAEYTYRIKIDQPGTYWYHSHVKGQYPEGLRAPIIVRDPNATYAGRYDEDKILSFSDRYHRPMSTLVGEFMNTSNPLGNEPVPKSALMNDTIELRIPVLPDKTYLFRMIVEVDGTYVSFTDPASFTDRIYMTAGQRYSVLVRTKPDASANFPIVAEMDTAMFDTIPDKLSRRVTGWLSYTNQKSYPSPQIIDDLAGKYLDDIELKPANNQSRWSESRQNITLLATMETHSDGKNYGRFNKITYVPPIIPTLFTAMTMKDSALKNASIYGDQNPFIIPEVGREVDIIIHNDDDKPHPFHLHGHRFQILYRSPPGGSLRDKRFPVEEYKQTPIQRDTVFVYGKGSVVLRFIADNPGVWMIHCHLEWHMVAGLAATIIEHPLGMQQSLKIPQDALNLCKSAGIPIEGEDVQKTTAEKPLPPGFEARGIVAIIFSAIAGIIGCSVIACYGCIGVGNESREELDPREQEEEAPNGRI